MTRNYIFGTLLFVICMPLSAQDFSLAFNQSRDANFILQQIQYNDSEANTTEPKTLRELNERLAQKHRSDIFYGKQTAIPIPYEQIKKYEGTRFGYVYGLDNEKLYKDWQYSRILKGLLYLSLGAFFAGLIYLGVKGKKSVKN